MNFERMRDFLLSLEHVVETEQFNGLVYWVGDKALGGKMFATMYPELKGMPIRYPTTAERFAELLEREGFQPAPYLARIFWIAAERWDVLRTAEWHEELTAAHGLVLSRLPAKTARLLALPAREQRAAISAGRKLAIAKKAARPAR